MLLSRCLQPTPTAACHATTPHAASSRHAPYFTWPRKLHHLSHAATLEFDSVNTKAALLGLLGDRHLLGLGPEESLASEPLYAR